MQTKKNLFQRASLISAKISFVISVVCGISLYFRVDEAGYQDPISASLLGSMFFFLFVGILLSIVGSSDIPSFKLDTSEKSEE
ncbi:MAG: hypothetical protein OQK78_08275 [Gammaproteobacteria bacterium]|nr:hypothetical protein [Gammaproteobacteria bacterium]